MSVAIVVGFHIKNGFQNATNTPRSLTLGPSIPTLLRRHFERPSSRKFVARETPVVHRNIALMLCDSAAVLEETLAQLETDDIPFQRLGDRGFVAPAQHVETVRDRLKARGIYPPVFGHLVDLEDALEEDDEDAADDTTEEEES
jgi:hypothetical protein